MPLSQDMMNSYKSFGQDIPQDYCEAYKFFKLFSLGEYLSVLTAKMTPTEIEEGERRYREFHSAKP